MQKRLRGLVVNAAVALGGLLVAGGAFCATTVTFESDPIGIAGINFYSADSTQLRFSPSPGGDLQVMPEVGSNEFLGTRGLAVFGTPDVSLVMEFSTPATSLQLTFGNDDFFSTREGDAAILVAFLGNHGVGAASVPLNRNDLIDQTIAISGTLFDRATFFYTADRFLAETVDNISFSLLEGAPPAMPEPAGALLLAFGLAVLLWKKLAGESRNGRAKA